MTTKTTATAPRPFHVEHLPAVLARGFWFRPDTGDGYTGGVCRVCDEHTMTLGAVYHLHTLTTDDDLCVTCGAVAVRHAVAFADAESAYDAQRLSSAPAPRGWEAV